MPWVIGGPAGRVISSAQKGPDIPNRLGQPAAFHRGALRKCRQQPRRRRRFQNDKTAFVLRSPDQAAKSLLQPETGNKIVIALAEPPPPRLVQDGGFGPG